MNYTNENSTNSTQADISATQWYIVIVPLLLVSCCLAFLLNCSILVLIRWIRRPFSLTTLLTMALAASDCYASFIVAIGFLVNSYLPQVQHVTVSPCFVLILEAFRLGACMTSVLHLLLLAVNHYLAIASPTSHNRLLTKRIAKLLVTIVYILPPALFLVIFGAFGSAKEEAFHSQSCAKTHFYQGMSFRLTTFCLLYGPFVIIAGLYAGMTYHLRLINQRQITMRRQSSAKSIQRRKRTGFTTLLMTLSFLIGWLPLGIFFLFTCTECAILSYLKQKRSLIWLLSTTFHWLLVLKFFLNPIIYGFRVPELRMAFRVGFGLKLNGKNQRGTTSRRETIADGETVENVNFRNSVVSFNFDKVTHL